MTIRAGYLAAAAALFVVEFLVATAFAHVRFVRGSLGDFLVVPFLYFLIQSFRRCEPAYLASGTFLFACAVEVSQYYHLASRLRLRPGSLAYTLLGDTFSFSDMLMDLLGAVAAYSLDRWSLSRRRPAPARP